MQSVFILGLILSGNSHADEVKLADPNSTSEFKVGDEFEGKVGDQTLHFKRVPMTTNEAPSKEVQDILDKASPVQELARIAPDIQSKLVYNAEFAKRYNLDPSQAVELGEGLYAVELVIKKQFLNSSALSNDSNKMLNRFESSSTISTMVSRNISYLFEYYSSSLDIIIGEKEKFKSFMMESYLNLYLDSKVSFKYPYNNRIMDSFDSVLPEIFPTDIASRGQISLYKLAGEPGFKARVQFFGGTVIGKDSFSYKVFISERLRKKHFWQRNPLFTVEDIIRYKKDIVPGLNYLSIGPISTYHLEQIGQHGYILLQKQGTPYLQPGFTSDYIATRDLKIADFNTYQLPEKLLKWEALQIAIAREDSTVVLDLKNNVSYMNFN